MTREQLPGLEDDTRNGDPSDAVDKLKTQFQLNREQISALRVYATEYHTFTEVGLTQATLNIMAQQRALLQAEEKALQYGITQDVLTALVDSMYPMET